MPSIIYRRSTIVVPDKPGESVKKRKLSHTPRKAKQKKKIGALGFLHESRKCFFCPFLLLGSSIPSCLALEKKVRVFYHSSLDKRINMEFECCYYFICHLTFNLAWASKTMDIPIIWHLTVNVQRLLFQSYHSHVIRVHIKGNCCRIQWLQTWKVLVLYVHSDSHVLKEGGCVLSCPCLKNTQVKWLSLHSQRMYHEKLAPHTLVYVYVCFVFRSI